MTSDCSSWARNKPWDNIPKYWLYFTAQVSNPWLVSSGLWIINEIVKYDYIYNHKNPYLPKFIDRKGDEFIQKNRHEILKDENILNDHLSQYKNMATKELIKKIHIEKFKLDLSNLFNNFVHRNSFTRLYINVYYGLDSIT